MFLILATALVGLYLILSSQQPVSSTVTLLFGILVLVLALLEFAYPRINWRRPPA
jgi:hypothetical protein